MAKHCVHCGKFVADDQAVCLSCGKLLTSYKPAGEAWSPGAVFAFSALGFLIPIVGAIIGVYALSQPAKKEQASTIFLWSLIGFGLGIAFVCSSY